MSLFIDAKGELRTDRIITSITMTILLSGAGFMYGCPVYNVWAQRLHGEAELARATANRKIAVQEAEAKKEAAALLGEAEVARAHGLAEANQIVGRSLGGPENYLRYLWIQQIDKVSGQVIYVPTENGLPLTEASRLMTSKQEKTLKSADERR